MPDINDNDYLDTYVRQGRGGTRGGSGGGGVGGRGGFGGYGGGGALGAGGTYSSAGGFARRRKVQQPALTPLVGGYRPGQPAPAPAPMTAKAGPGALNTARPTGFLSNLREMPQRIREHREQQAATAADAPTTSRDWVNDYVRGMMEDGALSPGGRRSRIEAIRDEVRRKGGANRQRALLRAKMLDPNDAGLASYAQVMADTGSGAAEQEAIGSARNDMEGENDAYLRQIIAMLRSGDQRWDEGQQGFDFDSARDSRGGGFGGFMGNVLGAGVGAFTGGLGRGAARRIFGDD